MLITWYLLFFLLYQVFSYSLSFGRSFSPGELPIQVVYQLDYTCALGQVWCFTGFYIDKREPLTKSNYKATLPFTCTNKSRIVHTSFFAFGEDGELPAAWSRFYPAAILFCNCTESGQVSSFGQEFAPVPTKPYLHIWGYREREFEAHKRHILGRTVKRFRGDTLVQLLELSHFSDQVKQWAMETSSITEDYVESPQFLYASLPDQNAVVSKEVMGDSFNATTPSTMSDEIVTSPQRTSELEESNTEASGSADTESDAPTSQSIQTSTSETDYSSNSTPGTSTFVPDSESFERISEDGFHISTQITTMQTLELKKLSTRTLNTGFNAPSDTPPLQTNYISHPTPEISTFFREEEGTPSVGFSNQTDDFVSTLILNASDVLDVDNSSSEIPSVIHTTSKPALNQENSTTETELQSSNTVGTESHLAEDSDNGTDTTDNYPNLRLFLSIERSNGTTVAEHLDTTPAPTAILTNSGSSEELWQSSQENKTSSSIQRNIQPDDFISSLTLNSSDVPDVDNSSSEIPSVIHTTSQPSFNPENSTATTELQNSSTVGNESHLITGLDNGTNVPATVKYPHLRLLSSIEESNGTTVAEHSVTTPAPTVLLNSSSSSEESWRSSHDGKVSSADSNAKADDLTSTVIQNSTDVPHVNSEISPVLPTTSQPSFNPDDSTATTELQNSSTVGTESRLVEGPDTRTNTPATNKYPYLRLSPPIERPSQTKVSDQSVTTSAPTVRSKNRLSRLTPSNLSARNEILTSTNLPTTRYISSCHSRKMQEKKAMNVMRYLSMIIF